MPRTLKAAILLAIAMIALPGYGFAEGLRIYAAGSLTSAFGEMVKEFPAPPGAVAAPFFGPSGILREKIEARDAVDVLASADMAQPRRLARGRPVIMFTRNRLCALGRQTLGLTQDNLLPRMLDPAVRLATSTPGADPGGDYAWAMFVRADTLHPGAQAILQAKALKLVGGPNTPPLVVGHGAVQGVFLADRADIMLGYCSGSGAVVKEVPGLVAIAVPPSLSVEPAYGMVVLSDQPLAARFALFQGNRSPEAARSPCRSR
jgi:ABC-type molybdate transport system substrate-binding protein